MLSYNLIIECISENLCIYISSHILHIRRLPSSISPEFDHTSSIHILLRLLPTYKFLTKDGYLDRYAVRFAPLLLDNYSPEYQCILQRLIEHIMFSVLQLILSRSVLISIGTRRRRSIIVARDAVPPATSDLLPAVLLQQLAKHAPSLR